MNIEDFINKKYGRLLVISYDAKKGNNHYVNCRCECGNTKSIRLSRLKSGETQSCGCIRIENLEKLRQINNIEKHGKSKEKLYNVYRNIKYRCYNSNCHIYKNYGGKGVKVCDDWLNDFMSFYNWAHSNGYQEGLSIDRIDVNGDYEPSNCRWSDNTTQANNRSNTIYLTHNNKTQSLSTWAKELSIPYATVYSRFSKGEETSSILRKKNK